MGLDLALLPLEEDDALCYSQTVLRCDQDMALFEEIRRLQETSGYDVRENFHSYLSRDSACEDSHYGRTVEDSYGARLKTLTAGVLCVYRHHHGVYAHVKNLAVWAYLSSLDPTTKVVLYWE